jgi:hypothetical protein
MEILTLVHFHMSMYAYAFSFHDKILSQLEKVKSTLKLRKII